MAFIKVCVALAFVAVASATPIAVSNEASELSTLEDSIVKFIARQDFSFELPTIGSTVTIGARNLDEDAVDLKVNLNTDGEGRSRNRLRKIFAPILILVILKAITLIPLALGILGLKTWNAIQLSFVTFIISVGLAVYEFCKKIAHDHAHPIVTAHGGWNAAAARAMPEEGAQDIAYSAYRK